MPGDRFAAAFSRVTAVELAYIPRHPQLSRNEHYDLVYVFRGVAQVGQRQVDFTAYVDGREAVGGKPPSPSSNTLNLDCVMIVSTVIDREDLFP